MCTLLAPRLGSIILHTSKRLNHLHFFLELLLNQTAMSAVDLRIKCAEAIDVRQ